MNRIDYRVLLISLSLLMMQSCSYQNRNTLFNTKERISNSETIRIIQGEKGNADAYRHRIKVGDRLVIRFLNNYDLGAAAQQSATSGASGTSAGVNLEKGYLVNYDSTVTLPMVGRIKMTGMTRLEASVKLEEEYLKYINNPIIEVNIANLGVTVLGEVNLQGRIFIDRENTTLVDVIAMAGGLKDSGRKRNIKIIRGNQVILVNLKKLPVLQLPELIMHDNDIVYVEPYSAKAASEPYISVQPLVAITAATLQTIILVFQFYLIYKN